MGYCVPDENLKPFVIVAIGGIIQYFMLLAITTIQIQRKIDEEQARERALKIEQDSNSKHITPPTPSQRRRFCLNVSNALIIWQCLSLWYIFISDIVLFARWRQQHRNESNWAKYNCLAEILFNSANFKTFLMIFAVSNQLRWGPTWDAISTAVGIGLCCPALAVCIIVCWFMVGGIPFLWYIPVSITHLVPAVACYCWIVIATSFVVRCSMFCWNRARPIFIKHKNDNEMEMENYSPMEKGNVAESIVAESINTEQSAWAQIEWDLTPLKWTAVMICMMVIVFSLCYWWSGEYEYMDSVRIVMTERKTVEYLSNVLNDLTSFAPFLCTVF